MNGSSSREIAVIKARLPYVDRRALSQAWFSALHLAERASAPAKVRRLGPSAVIATPARVRVPHARPAAYFDHRPAAVRDGAGARPARYAGNALVPVLVGKKTRASAAVVALRYPPVRASFHLDLDGGRVQIVVRREGSILHVVALCSRRHVELVRKALGCAALYLSARGESLQSDVRAVDPESVR